MAGRPSKPVQLVKMEGKSHRTKKELEHREKMEQSLYTGIKFKESPAVKSDPIAHKEFLRLKKLYKHIEYVDGLDQQIINRYCMTISQEESYAKQIEILYEKINEVEGFEEQMKVYDSINKATTKLNQIKDMLLKLEDRLFLNPTSRVKAIPKTPPEDNKNKSPMQEFLKRKAGGSGAT
ncbi:P27 family phage terminase small subunit [Terrihalobacillus insolitus]|uniref:P27 family phage terminase small subunit n=1 Tax=Terrihalobacillus insolitus TaxID=2950438 RepID=UPI002341A57F|nr:P27 family phage terminase small subunit [Terrihalobacillus insolitus]MDC3414280.1 P27 family phage terminase small subunit [Terrihalobacillus insolitus]